MQPLAGISWETICLLASPLPFKLCLSLHSQTEIILNQLTHTMASPFSTHCHLPSFSSSNHFPLPSPSSPSSSSASFIFLHHFSKSSLGKSLMYV